MSEHQGFDPIETLRALNPVDPRDASSASLARVSARVQENMMADLNHSTPRQSRHSRFIGALAASVAAIALAVAVSGPLGFGPGSSPVAVVPSPSGEPTDAPIIGGGGGMASCIRYELEILAHNGFAFDGTVTAVDANTVSFTVNKAFKGVTDTTVSLPNPDYGAITSFDGLEFKLGDRYLVTGTDTVITTCGYSQAYDAKVAAEWEATFAR